MSPFAFMTLQMLRKHVILWFLSFLELTLCVVQELKALKCQVMVHVLAEDCSTSNQKVFSRFGITHQLLLLGAPYDIQAFEDNTQQEIWSGPDLLHTSHKLSCLLLQKWLGW